MREGKAAEWCQLELVVVCFVVLIHTGFYLCHIYGTQYTYYYYYVTLINIMKNVGEVMGWGKLLGTGISTKIIAIAFMSVLKVLMQLPVQILG